VGRLPDDRRRAVVLRFVEEMSVAEIAGVLGKTEGAVRVLLHRALRSVAADLRRIDAAARDDGRNARDAATRHAGRGRPEGSR
jgi:RNA polymerase sigma-70 factor (ECF subfamily)